MGKIFLKNQLERIDYLLYGMVVLVGFSGGLAIFALHLVVEFLSAWLQTNQSFSIWTTIISFSLAALSLYATGKWFKDTNGSGIPQVTLSLVALKGKFLKRMPFGKFLTTALTLSSGLSFGKEGPSVTISASLASFYSTLFKLNAAKTRLLVAAGSAAGLSAAFHTPIAAVVFTIEEITGEINSKFLGPIVIASVVASVTSYTLLGNNSTFIPVQYAIGQGWDILLYVILGIMIGSLGHVWIHSVVWLKKIKTRYFKDKNYYYLFIAIVIMALLSKVDPKVLGHGVNSINDMIIGKFFSIDTLLILFFAKFFLSALSYSTGLSGGLFMPILFNGAISGLLFATLLQYIWPTELELGSFALIGMTCFLVSVIKTPFTAFVMLFEMTRDYDFILPLMLASIVAHIVSESYGEESVYEILANYEGVHLPGAKDKDSLAHMNVNACMATEIITIEATDYLPKVYQQVEKSPYTIFPVLRQGQLVGLVSKQAIVQDRSVKRRVIHISNKDIISVHPDESLLEALNKMTRYDIGRIPVVSRFNIKRLIGMITSEDIIKYFQKKKS